MHRQPTGPAGQLYLNFKLCKCEAIDKLDGLIFVRLAISGQRVIEVTFFGVLVGPKTL